jgi:hypothetical protein
MFDGGSGYSGDGPKFPGDGNLADHVKEAIMRVVIKAMR